MKIVSGITFFLFTIVFSLASAKIPSMASNSDTILAKAVDGFSVVRDFVVTIDAEIKMERVQVPKMHATMYFKRPDKIHFNSQGFLFVPRDGIVLNPAMLAERYDASLIGTDTLNSTKVYKLQLAAKEKKTKLRQMYIWIEPAHWTISKIETIPYEGRTLSLIFTYMLVKEKFWLPSKIIFSFSSTVEKENSSEDLSSQQTDQFSQIQSAIPRNGSVTILYSDYNVNAGIDDSVFEKK